MKMALALMLIAGGVWPARSAADDPHAAHRIAATGASAATVVLPGARLIASDGSVFPLSAAQLGERVVVVDFVFTSCRTICPALTAVMSSLQQTLAAELGRDVLLLSISLDPARDAPAVLRAFSRRVGASPSWLWLTGSAAELKRVWSAFGVPSGRPEEHAPLLLVGRPSNGKWLRWVGIPDAELVADGARALLGAEK
jgi:protein SCO1